MTIVSMISLIRETTDDGMQLHINEDAVVVSVGQQGFRMEMNRSLVRECYFRK